MGNSEIERGRLSLSRLMRQEGDADALAHELLEACFGGFPVESLSDLLTTSDPDLDKIGAWVASELGHKAQPIYAQVARLLRSRSSYARFFALDTVLLCAGEADSEILADAVLLLDDSESSVRWKTIQFLIRASPKQLEAATTGLMARGQTTLAGAVQGLASGSPGDQGMLELLASESGTLRRIGLVGAVRRAPDDDSALKAAARSNDADIAQIAGEELAKLQKEGERAKERAGRKAGRTDS